MGLGYHSGAYHEGDHAVICDICGLRFRKSQTSYNWKHQLVCGHCWEERNPQEYQVTPKGDPQGVPDPRPRSTVTYIQQYYELKESSGDIPAIIGAGILSAS